jgi:type IV pilus assembly protein PilX
MSIRMNNARRRERGIVLISSLLLLIVVTIIALSMFRSFGIQERIAGSMREKQRALQAAITAETYAENWIIDTGYSSSAPSQCNSLLNANILQGQICSNPLTSIAPNVTVVPWSVGVNFTPPNMQISTTTSITSSTNPNPTYYGAPMFYIADMGPSADSTIPGEVYLIDAAGYGGNSNTAAVVESTFVVYTTSSNRGGL